MPADYNAVDWIYSFKDVTLNIFSFSGAAPYSVPVASIRIILKNNDIPMVSLLLDPSKGLLNVPGAATPPNEEELQPKAPTLDEMADFYKELQKEVNNTQVFGTVLGEISCNSDTQELLLSGWRVVGVGISGLSAGGSFSVTMRLAHPAYDATRASCWLPNMENISKIPDSLVGSQPNPPQGFAEACFAYLAQGAKVIKDGNASGFDQAAAGKDPSLKKIGELLVPRSEEAVTALTQNISWDPAGGTDVPFANNSAVGSALSEIIGRCFWGYSGRPSVSVWSVFAGVVVPAFELTVNGDATLNPLIVSPFCPWGKPLGAIYDDEVADISLPDVDADPLAAVLAKYFDSASEESFSMYIPTNEAGQDGAPTPQELTSGGGYLAALEQGIMGKVAVFNPPDWARDFLKLRATLNGEGGSSGGFANLLGPQNFSTLMAAAQSGRPPQANPTKDDYVKYRSMLNAWTEQSFFRGYRYAMSVSIRTRLMISNPDLASSLPGGRLRPGVSLELKARDTDKTIFYFYVTSVTHVIDSQNSQAYTNIQGSYLRSDEQILKNVLTESDLTNGVKNTLYDSVGEINPDPFASLVTVFTQVSNRPTQ